MVASSAASAIESISAATTAPRLPVVAGPAVSRAAELVLPTPGFLPLALATPAPRVPSLCLPLAPTYRPTAFHLTLTQREGGA
ncbi:extradiol ring-cleavage dioxygenase class III protein subunit B [Streptomyces azureus]|uniref:Extradiol ring-cleavage dioxygenase class III protein subunit B n=1 Tax=Streptomyces azureus TaxID=146537 RepID=A0A0K8PG38_STRAJ|nr:extradiol ring-cleavage dioxygenase class III protein subunit B [Streptomyces azureus]